MRAFQWNKLFETQFDKVLECEKEVYLNHDLFQENIKKTWLEYMESFVLKLLGLQLESQIIQEH